MRHLCSVVIAAVLLGVPRVLDGRSFGAQRSVYVEVAPESPELADLVTELGRAIGGAAYSLASSPSEATLVVELLGVGTSRAADGRSMEAASFTIREGSGSRPVVLHYPPDRRAAGGPGAGAGSPSASRLTPAPAALFEEKALDATAAPARGCSQKARKPEVHRWRCTRGPASPSLARP